MDDHRTPSQPDPAENPALQPILIHDKSLPGKIAEGSEARDVLDQQILVLGAQLVNQLHILLKTIRIHERTNAAVNQVVDATVTTVKTLARDNPVVIRLQNDFLYLGDAHLKMGPQQVAIFLEFIDSLNARGIAAISFSAEMRETDLREFAYQFISVDPATCTFDDLKRQLKEGEIHGIDIEEATSLMVRVGQKNKQLKNLAKQLYVKAVGAVGEVLQSIREGRAPNFRRAKRVVQSIVDVILQDEPTLLGLTTLRCYDEYTHNHSVNVSLLSVALGNRAGYPREALVDLGLAALFHDLGKASIPQDILNKSEEFTDEDWAKLRIHATLGVINLIRLRGLTNLPGRMAAAAFEHHLNYDLSGYPTLSMPWEVSLTGRILMVADCYDSMTSSRVYRRDPIAPNKVLTMMFAKSGILYDPVLLKLFVNCVGIIPIGCLTLLDSHELAVVIRPSANRQTATRPYVKLISDRSGRPIEGPEVDLAEKDADGRFKRSVVRLVDNTEYRFDTGRYFA
ncbi:MAG: hypothetical protein AUH35_01120 [Nitrospirae bacterium 13_1_40CM_62_7]|nr:MAG: hypothetical protein AUH35_01120 [Nitrospirae bacterium 13_1_40CM_62_7]